MSTRPAVSVPGVLAIGAPPHFSNVTVVAPAFTQYINRPSEQSSGPSLLISVWCWGFHIGANWRRTKALYAATLVSFGARKSSVLVAL